MCTITQDKFYLDTFIYSNFMASIIIYKHYNVFRINIIVNRNVFSILIPIRRNRLSEEQTLTEVRGLTNTEHIASYSGFFTVDRNYNSNLFFWFFPSTVSLLLLFLPRISFLIELVKLCIQTTTFIDLSS